MFKRFLIPLLLILLVSCKEEIVLNEQLKPGVITGKVMPLGVKSSVKLYLGVLLKEVEADENGIFQIEDVAPGTYRMEIKAEGYRAIMLNQIAVNEGSGHDIGILTLSDIPYPIDYVIPRDESIRVRTEYYNKIHIYFSEHMDQLSLEDGISISPKINIISKSYATDIRSSRSQYTILGELKLDTKYSVHIGSEVKTFDGEVIEFPYVFNFRTDDFQIPGAISFQLIHQLHFFQIN